MLFNKSKIHTMTYHLGSQIVSSDELERVLNPVFKRLGIATGTIESLTGIRERRWWEQNTKMADMATIAGEKALTESGIDRSSIGMFIYAGVCRDYIEPATATIVADNLGITQKAIVYDISNACIGVLNGVIQICQAIELGHIDCGMVVSSESSREIIEITINHLLKNPQMDSFKRTLATLTGGSGATAILLTSENLSKSGHKILGAAIRNNTSKHSLCRWESNLNKMNAASPGMETDSVQVLKHGIALGIDTYRDLKDNLKMLPAGLNKTICHQIGRPHHETILRSLELDIKNDFATYETLGNMGTVALPATVAIADDHNFFNPGDIVGLLGIGSGLNCLMLGIEW